MAKRKTLAELLRGLIRESGLSLRELSRQTGIPQPRLTVFMGGKEIRTDTAQKLIDHFGVTFKTK